MDISFSSRGWKSKVRVPEKLVLVRTFFWVTGHHLLVMSFHKENKEREVSVFVVVCLQIYLCIWESFSEFGRERLLFLLLVASLPRWPQQLGLDQAKTRSTKPFLGLPQHLDQALSPPSTTFPRLLADSWNRYSSIWVLNWCPYGMPTCPTCFLLYLLPLWGSCGLTQRNFFLKAPTPKTITL